MEEAVQVTELDSTFENASSYHLNSQLEGLEKRRLRWFYHTADSDPYYKPCVEVSIGGV